MTNQAKVALLSEVEDLNSRLHYARGRQYVRLLTERDKVQAQLTELVRAERLSDNEFLHIIFLELREMDADDGDAALDYLANLRSDLTEHLEYLGIDVEEPDKLLPTNEQILSEIGALRSTSDGVLVASQPNKVVDDRWQRGKE